MSVSYTDAPQWLLSSWMRACAEAGATAAPDDIRETGEALLARWMDPRRRFHDLRHLCDVLSRVDELAEETHEPSLVRLAAWYHGAIFDAESKAAYAERGGENETASAVLAHEQLAALGVPDRRAHRVAQLVTALLRHAPDPADFDCAVLCDADLGMLAQEPQRYKAYLEDVRAEYAHIPAEDYVRARIVILSKLLSRPSLFSSPLGAAWEDAARQNITAELMRLKKELAKLNADDAALLCTDDMLRLIAESTGTGVTGTDGTGTDSTGVPAAPTPSGAGEDGRLAASLPPAPPASPPTAGEPGPVRGWSEVDIDEDDF